MLEPSRKHSSRGAIFVSCVVGLGVDVLALIAEAQQPCSDTGFKRRWASWLYACADRRNPAAVQRYAFQASLGIMFVCLRWSQKHRSLAAICVSKVVGAQVHMLVPVAEPKQPCSDMRFKGGWGSRVMLTDGLCELGWFRY